MATTLYDVSASALLDSLPPLLSVGIRRYAEQCRHGDVACVCADLKDHLAHVNKRGYSAIAAAMDVHLLTTPVVWAADLVRALAESGAEVSDSWRALVDACVHVHALAHALTYEVRHGVPIQRLLTPDLARRLDSLVRGHVFPRKPYSQMLLNRLDSLSRAPLSIPMTLSLAEASVNELRSDDFPILPVQSRHKLTEAKLDATSGNLRVRLDSLSQPEFWAELVIPRDVALRLLSTHSAL